MISVHYVKIVRGITEFFHLCHREHGCYQVGGIYRVPLFFPTALYGL